MDDILRVLLVALFFLCVYAAYFVGGAKEAVKAQRDREEQRKVFDDKMEAATAEFAKALLERSKLPTTTEAEAQRERAKRIRKAFDDMNSYNVETARKRQV